MTTIIYRELNKIQLFIQVFRINFKTEPFSVKAVINTIFLIMNTEEINVLCRNTLIEHLGIVFTEITDKHIKAQMPVDQRTIQPMGLLHGGASLALAETVGSVGSFTLVDPAEYDVVGMQVNGNHIGNTKTKYVTATGKIIHRGTRTHVWDVIIEDEHRKPVSVCRVTNMLLKKERGA
jgi:1,4-dihydroxy-2-naphthoyl-CoA hydrolase